ncbi:MAG: hypothetical protein O9274_05675 [Limnobacter sp.]|uniref:hypothetical protein n=1 Tax=Limnobacter sp. TaxID=2003368 RepID=UPI0022C3906E|nr:hypothetical protein [Limnobacter sp.]MCZ8015168.1 hypothetical protein [Limnobacter sp.]
MQVGYSDFVLLCQVENPNDWLGYLLKSEGVYLHEVSSEAFLTPAERAELTSHPKGNPAEALLQFPCSIDDLESFFDQQSLHGQLDAFQMVRWFQKKQLKTDTNNSKVNEATNSNKPLSTKEKNTLLTIIAGLCDFSAIDFKKRGCAKDIAAYTEEIGAPVDEDTVLRWIKQIPDALESRMKS